MASDRRPVHLLRPYTGWWCGEYCWILMRLEYIPVAPIRVPYLRGWRYLEDADAPADLVLPEDVPADIDDRLADLGVR